MKVMLHQFHWDKSTVVKAGSSSDNIRIYDMLRHNTLRHSRMAPLDEVSAICSLQLEVGWTEYPKTEQFSQGKRFLWFSLVPKLRNKQNIITLKNAAFSNICIELNLSCFWVIFSFKLKCFANNPLQNNKYESQWKRKHILCLDIGKFFDMWPQRRWSKRLRVGLDIFGWE